MSKALSFFLDGREIQFRAGETIMDAATAAGEYIPHLCHNPELESSGSCRICTVVVDGRYLSSCTAPAVAGSQVENNSDQVNLYRKSLLQMLFVEGNHQCPGCERSGRCQLQAVAYYVGMLSTHFTHFFPQRKLDGSHPDMVIDFNRCILCGLCVRASREIDRKCVFAIGGGRGIEARLVINSDTGLLGDSVFTIHDKAAKVCPVGAMLPKNQGYEVPIGERLYDQHPITLVGDVATHRHRGGR